MSLQDYDLNGRIKMQRNGAESLAYSYNNASYRPDHVNGTTPLAPGREMSMEGNFQWDADGRLIYDASRDMLVDYDAAGMPTEFRRTDLSDTLGERGISQTQLYGPDGIRTATFNWIDSAGSRILVGIRTDIVIGQRKRSEVWESYDESSGNQISIREFTVIQGQSSSVGRIRPDGLDEWYIKDHQGSLAISIVGDGYGSAYTYHPFGAQNILRTDGQQPTEQYTGKEWDGQYEFYYFGARFLDPVLGMWATPDPAGQYANPYAFGFDPIKGSDPNGLWFGIDDAIAAGVGAIAGGVTACLSGHCDVTDGKFWAYVGAGAAIGEAALYTGGAAAGAASGMFAAGSTAGVVAGGVAAGAAGGAVAGAGNYIAGSGIETGFSNFSGSDLWTATWTSAAAGAVGGGVSSYMSTAGWNLMGRGGAAFAGGFTGGFAGGLLNGQSLSSSVKTGLIGAGTAWGVDKVSAIAHRQVDPIEGRANSGSDITQDKTLKKGDRIVFAPEEGFDPQSFLTNEDYTHAAVVDYTDGQMVLREANIYQDGTSGNQLFGGGYSSGRSPLSNFAGRAYTNLGGGTTLVPFQPSSSGYYVQNVNCTTQASAWTGGGFVNNPGVWARRIYNGM